VNEDTWIPPVTISNADEILEKQGGLPEYWKTKYAGQSLNMYTNWKYSVKIKNPMDLRQFPFDSDSFEVHIDGSNDDVALHGLQHHFEKIEKYRPGLSFIGVSRPPISEEVEWRIYDVEIDEQYVDMGEEIKQLTFKFSIVRIPYFYIFKVVMLLIMITVLGFGAYTYKRDDAGDRLNYVMTTLLASSAFMFVISSNLPTLAYLTALDKLVIASFSCQFMTGIISLMAHVGGGLDDDVDTFSGVGIFCCYACYTAFAVVRGVLKYKAHPILTRKSLEARCLESAMQLKERIERSPTKRLEEEEEEEEEEVEVEMEVLGAGKKNMI
jgi:hypothetical protein